MIYGWQCDGPLVSKEERTVVRGNKSWPWGVYSDADGLLAQLATTVVQLRIEPGVRGSSCAVLLVFLACQDRSSITLGGFSVC